MELSNNQQTKMKKNVFLCCMQSNKYQGLASSDYNFWRENFKLSLENLGCNVLEPHGFDFIEPFFHSDDSDWYKHRRVQLSDHLYDFVVKTHKNIGIDLFLSYFFATHVTPEFLTAIRDLGIPVVNFFCDNMRDFDLVRPLASSVTLNWVPEIDAIAKYKLINAPAIYLPMAVNTDFYKTTHEAELNQVSFIGSADYLRMHVLQPMIKTSIPLRIYGNGWRNETELSNSPHNTQASNGTKMLGFLAKYKKRLNYLMHLGPIQAGRYVRAQMRSVKAKPLFKEVASPPVSHRDYVKILGSSMVTLGINRCPNLNYPLHQPLRYSRLRDFEAPLTGACYLTEHCSDLENLFDIGTEVLSYRDSMELIEKTLILLKDKCLRQKLRQNGHEAITSRHTWGHRFKKLFFELNI